MNRLSPPLDHPHDDAHDQGLAHDLLVLQRRRALGWLAGTGGLLLFGCGGGGGDAATTTSSSSDTGSSSGSTSGTVASGSCSVIPEETAGPYPGDGSNTVNGSIANALTLSGIVRSDIRSSIAGASGTAGGVPLTLTIELVNTNASCADLAGYAIYLWHCDREGRYSMYSSGVTNQNYLRGVQETGSDGTVTFTTVFPGCYSGRMPHMHFEVYRNANTASSYTNKLKTSQIAFPTEVCSTVYNSASGYSASIANLAAISFSSDNVFSDGVSTQLASLAGSVAAGYSATLRVGISV
ncbi:MAG TPA: intradiol ring-cleavage dioxygenase [Roseateles sp.]|nr:intradiol ring-cleavage dioxygenase [Roseateles sp.]